MAFVGRGNRETDLSKNAGTETSKLKNLGPGSQNVDVLTKERHNMVPFSSSSIREGAGDKNQNPGPGQQVAEQQAKNFQDPFHEKRMSSQFSSKVDRFSQMQQHKRMTPGPGQQQTKPQTNKWNETTPSNLRRKEEEKMHQVRLPSAPSIPASHQVFGYEEASNGDLIMQKNPDKVYTGTNKDSVGPGSQNLHRSLESNQGMEWGKSKSARLKKINIEDGLGPGAQDNVLPQNLGKESAFKNKKSSVFTSDVPRGNPNRREKKDFLLEKKDRRPEYNSRKSIEESDNEDEEDTYVIPGPGHQNAHGVHAMRPDQKPERLQFFGSTQERFKPMGIARLGPGSQDPAASKGSKKGKAPQGMGFESNLTRFVGEEGMVLIPGPGTQGADGLVDNLNKKVWGRRGIFGSSEVRFVTQSGTMKTPGPGSQKTEDKARKKKHATNSVFKSAVPKVDMDFEEMVPGPGAYESKPRIGNDKGYIQSGLANPIQASLIGGAVTKPGFNSKEDRLGIIKAEAKPGPGAQGHSDMIKHSIEKINPQSKAGFGTMDKRFEEKESSPLKNPSSLGPGTYNTDNAWVKKTFNMLFAEQ